MYFYDVEEKLGLFYRFETPKTLLPGTDHCDRNQSILFCLERTLRVAPQIGILRRLWQHGGVSGAGGAVGLRSAQQRCRTSPDPIVIADMHTPVLPYRFALRS